MLWVPVTLSLIHFSFIFSGWENFTLLIVDKALTRASLIWQSQIELLPLHCTLLLYHSRISPCVTDTLKKIHGHWGCKFCFKGTVYVQKAILSAAARKLNVRQRRHVLFKPYKMMRKSSTSPPWSLQQTCMSLIRKNFSSSFGIG